MPLDILEHYGIKGMRWGKTSVDNSAPTAVSVKPGRVGKTIKTTGGNKQPASADAMSAAVSKRMALKSSTDSLSTKQLQEMVNRMNLEQQYSRLEKDSFRSKSGTKMATKVIKEHGAQAVLLGGGLAIKKHPAVATVKAVQIGLKVATLIAANSGGKKKKKG